jgi:hypothetical protein
MHPSPKLQGAPQQGSSVHSSPHLFPFQSIHSGDSISIEKKKEKKKRKKKKKEKKKKGKQFETPALKDSIGTFTSYIALRTPIQPPKTALEGQSKVEPVFIFFFALLTNCPDSARPNVSDVPCRRRARDSIRSEETRRLQGKKRTKKKKNKKTKKQKKQRKKIIMTTTAVAHGVPYFRT